MGKKYKKCKVEYSDNVEVNYEVNCIEIKTTKYRIYGRTRSKGWELLCVKTDKQKAIDYAKNLNPNIYDSKMLIEENKEKNMDIPIDIERE